MDKNIYKNEGQFQLLVDAFDEVRMWDPEISTVQALTRAVLRGGFSARTITRGLDLVDEKDFCTDPLCEGCVDHYDKKTLKVWLHHLAYPAVLKVKHYTVEEIRKMREAEEIN